MAKARTIAASALSACLIALSPGLGCYEVLAAQPSSRRVLIIGVRAQSLGQPAARSAEPRLAIPIPVLFVPPSLMSAASPATQDLKPTAERRLEAVGAQLESAVKDLAQPDASPEAISGAGSRIENSLGGGAETATAPLAATAEPSAPRLASPHKGRLGRIKNRLSLFIAMAGLSALAACVTPKTIEPAEPRGAAPVQTLTLGRNATPGVLLGAPSGNATPPGSQSAGLSGSTGFAPGLPGLESSPVDLQTRDVPPPIRLEYGRMPTFMSDARLAQSAYHLVSWGGDELLDNLPVDGGGKIALRIGKSIILDIPSAVYTVAPHHEWGHFKSIWNQGIYDIAFQPDPTTFLGVTPTVGLRGSLKLTPNGQLDFTAGGTMASSNLASDLQMQIFEKDYVDWSYFTLWGASKADISIYSFFIFPTMRHLKPGDENNDMMGYTLDYSNLYGGSHAHIRREIIRGATLNLLDPTFLWGSYAYFYRYLINGDERTENPMTLLSLGDFGFWGGTGFWLARNGPQYRFTGLVRHNPSGALLIVAPTIGDNSQLTVQAELRHIPLATDTYAKIFGGMWNQRSQAEPGPKHMGYCVGGGLECNLIYPFGIAIDAGYKTAGALIGRGFQKGAFVEGGIVLFPERTKRALIDFGK